MAINPSIIGNDVNFKDVKVYIQSTLDTNGNFVDNIEESPVPVGDLKKVKQQLESSLLDSIELERITRENQINALQRRVSTRYFVKKVFPSVESLQQSFSQIPDIENQDLYLVNGPNELENGLYTNRSLFNVIPATRSHLNYQDYQDIEVIDTTGDRYYLENNAVARPDNPEIIHSLKLIKVGCTEIQIEASPRTAVTTVKTGNIVSVGLNLTEDLYYKTEDNGKTYLAISPEIKDDIALTELSVQDTISKLELLQRKTDQQQSSLVNMQQDILSLREVDTSESQQRQSEDTQIRLSNEGMRAEITGLQASINAFRESMASLSVELQNNIKNQNWLSAIKGIRIPIKEDIIIAGKLNVEWIEGQTVITINVNSLGWYITQVVNPNGNPIDLSYRAYKPKGLICAVSKEISIASANSTVHWEVHIAYSSIYNPPQVAGRVL